MSKKETEIKNTFVDVILAQQSKIKMQEAEKVEEFNNFVNSSGFSG